MIKKLFKLNKGLFYIFIFIFLINLASCSFNKKGVSIERIEIVLANNTIQVGESTSYKINVYPNNINANLTFTIDSKIAKVLGNKIEGVSEGTTEFKIKTKDGKVEAKQTITVTNILKGVKINVDKTSLYIGEELDLKYITTPINNNSEFAWSYTSSTSDIVEIKNNKLHALKQGTVHLTCYSVNDGSIFDKVTITILHPLIDNENAKAYGIVGAFGEDASHEFNVHYSIENTTSSVLVTTDDDLEFKNATRYYGDGYYFEETDPAIACVWEARNIWHVEITDLDSDTSYIYKIDNGDETYSDIYHFRTAGNNKTSFVYLTDVHYSMLDSNEYPSHVSEKTIENALKENPNISFILDGGDLIDTGGNDQIWKKYFSYAESLKTLPKVGVPGNHEYYINTTGQRDNSYFAAYSADPLNGPESLLGSACWFIHNETLFILIDNIKGIGYDEQYRWAENLLATKDYKYSVVVHHAPVNQDTTDKDENYLKLYDKYQVNLVLSGHYHWQKVDQNIYNGTRYSDDQYLGTTYFTGTCGGAKSRPSGTAIEDFARGYIVDIDDDGITIKCIMANGSIISTHHINNKKPTEYEKVDKDTLMKTITTSLDEEKNELVVSWANTFYKNVKKVELSENYRNELYEYEVCPTPGYTKMVLSNIIPYYDYNFELKVTFSDDSTRTINFSIDRHTDLNPQILVKDDNNLLFQINGINNDVKNLISKYVVYIDGVYFKDLDYRLSASTVSYYLENISNYKTIEIYAVGYENNILFKQKIV